MRRLGLIVVLVALISACGDETKHVKITINGATVTTSSAAACAKFRAYNAGVTAYNVGVDAWNALSQAERDASHAPTDAPETYQANWMRAHGYPTAPPANRPGVVIGCH